MKKKQLSKAALKGLAIGAMMASTMTLSALNDTQGTYLAGNCGAGSCSGANRPNPKNYTADTYTPTTDSVVNPNMAPKPDSMQNNINQNRIDQRGSGSCGAQGQSNGTGCGARPQPSGQTGPQQMGNAQRPHNHTQYAPTHSCNSNISSSGQASCASSNHGRGTSYR